jgi:hypothetical protein
MAAAAVQEPSVEQAIADYLIRIMPRSTVKVRMSLEDGVFKGAVSRTGLECNGRSYLAIGGLALITLPCDCLQDGTFTKEARAILAEVIVDLAKDYEANKAVVFAKFAK